MTSNNAKGDHLLPVLLPPSIHLLSYQMTLMPPILLNNYLSPITLLPIFHVLPAKLDSLPAITPVSCLPKEYPGWVCQMPGPHPFQYILCLQWSGSGWPLPITHWVLDVLPPGTSTWALAPGTSVCQEKIKASVRCLESFSHLIWAILNSNKLSESTIDHIIAVKLGCSSNIWFSGSFM